jgi:hypothetical protein
MFIDRYSIDNGERLHLLTVKTRNQTHRHALACSMSSTICINIFCINRKSRSIVFTSRQTNTVTVERMTDKSMKVTTPTKQLSTRRHSTMKAFAIDVIIERRNEH